MSESEAQVTDEVVVPAISNYSSRRKTVTMNGDTEEWMEVKFGENPSDPSLPAHMVDVRRTDMADQFDLVEIASGQVDNDLWLSLAIVAMSVRAIDGVPQVSGNLTKAALRKTLKTIGPVGVRAVRRALSELDGPAQATTADAGQKAAVGN